MNDSKIPTGHDCRPLLQRKTVWGLILTIALMAEYQLIYWTSDFGSDPDVVGHVGFAGTIVSTILALVAIGYAYYQTFSQRRDADAIAAQILGLREVLVSLDSSSDELKDQATALRDVHEAITRVGTTQTEVLDAQRRLETTISNLQNAAKKQARAPARSAPEDSYRAKAIEKFVADAVGLTLVSLLTLAEAVSRGKSVNEATKLMTEIGKKAHAGKSESFIDSLTSFYEGVLTGFFWALIAQDCLSYVNTIPGDLAVKRSPDFEKAVRQRADVVRARGENKKSDPINVALFDEVNQTFWDSPEAQETRVSTPDEG